MRFNKSEIDVLVLVAGADRALHPSDFYTTLEIRPETLSRLITSLVNKGILERKDKEIALSRSPAAETFKRLYFSHRASPLSLLLAERRIDLLSLMENEHSVVMLEKETGIPKKTIYRYLKGLLRLGVTKRRKVGRTYLYSLNKTLWPEIGDFVSAIQEYQAMRLVPREALLIKIYREGVLFKSIRPQDATPTSFSAYEEYGIELGLRDYYYILPKRKLSIQEIFIHSLDSALEFSQKLFCLLFYLKNKERLKDIEHPMMKDLLAVLHGERIKGYPTLEDIADRVDLYDIQL